MRIDPLLPLSKVGIWCCDLGGPTSLRELESFLESERETIKIVKVDPVTRGLIIASLSRIDLEFLHFKMYKINDEVVLEFRKMGGRGLKAW